MAVTAIWDVKGWLGDVVNYAENPDKTENPKWTPDKNDEWTVVMENAMHDAKERGLAKVLNYAVDDFKTEQRYFVTGINCKADIARQQMLIVKKQWGKEDGIVAFHGYQSFVAGEVTPTQAHKIGVELAEKLWGNRFQVVVATHLNTKSVHNHFVINSVSFADGKRYYDNNATYALMRKSSDELCRKYRLSVIDTPQNRGKHYAEWKAENEGRPTWRTAICEDVDKAIMAAMTWGAFLRSLREQGYEIKTDVKYIAIKPPGKEHFVRIKSLGENYTEEAVKTRILKQRVPMRSQEIDTQNRSTVRFKGSFSLHKVTYKSIRALYYYYLHMLRAAQKQPERAPYVLREDLRYMHDVSAQAVFMNKHKIDTLEQVEGYKEEAINKISALYEQRRELTNEARRKETAPERKAEINEKLAGITSELSICRKEARLCEEIFDRAGLMKEVLRKIQKKEMKKDEQHRGRGGTDSRSRDEHNGKGR